MFGRVRPASSPAESLERTPSKIVKDNSLSVFENTLVKLKLGSKIPLDSGCEQHKAEDVDKHIANSNTADVVLEDSFERKLSSNNNVSVIYLFSKYRRSRGDNACSQ